MVSYLILSKKSLTATKHRTAHGELDFHRFNFRPFVGILLEIKKRFCSYSACVVYAKTIIHLSVGESGGYLPRRCAAREISTTIHLPWSFRAPTFRELSLVNVIQIPDYIYHSPAGNSWHCPVGISGKSFSFLFFFSSFCQK